MIKPGRPYLDEITFKIVESQATRLLAFQTGDFDITFPSDVHVPLFKDLQARTPNATCQMVTTGTCVTPFEIAPGDLVTVDFGSLGTASVRIG